MLLSDLSIRRPVLASMLSLALVLFGVIGYRQLNGEIGEKHGDTLGSGDRSLRSQPQ